MTPRCAWKDHEWVQSSPGRYFVCTKCGALNHMAACCDPEGDWCCVCGIEELADEAADLAASQAKDMAP